MRNVRFFIAIILWGFLMNFTNAQTNQIIGVSNNGIQTNYKAVGNAADYIKLPALDLSGKFTIETWFKSTADLNSASVPSWSRVFDFGNGPNQTACY